MIIVKKDSEVMTNYVAANPVPAGQNFGVFHDKNLQPAVFALGEDGILNLIITIGREPSKVDFGKASALFPEDTEVQAFAVLQSPDSSLDICIATKATDTTSNFYLLHHITLDEIPGTMPSAKVIHGVFPTVDHIYMGHKSSDMEQSLPLVMVAFTRPDRLTSTEDLSYVKFGDEASLVTSWSLPVNPKKIYDVTLGTCPLGDGVFVLYEGFSEEMFLVFKVLDGDDDDDGDGFAVQINCPERATCLASYLDPATTWTVLLVGGKVITAFTYNEYKSPHGGQGNEIDNLDKIADLKDLHISQTGENLRLWYTTSADAVYYYTTTTTSLSSGLLLPLLADGLGGRISSLLSSRPREGDSDALVSSLLSVDEHGNLSLLQQDTTSQAWQLYPFWHASVENVIEVKGLMVRLHATLVNNDDGDTADLLPGCWLRVSSSGLVRCIINGRHTTLSPTPQWYQTDPKGVLNVLLQTDDATIHQFAADAYRPAQGASEKGTERNLSDPILDPTYKLVPKLEGIQTADDVRGLKKPDGSPLLPDDISDKDAKGAAEAFKQLVASAKDVQEKDKVRLQAYHAAISPENRAVTAEGIVPLGFWGDVGDWFKGAWNWLTDVAKDVWSWTCELIGDVWHFVLKIGEEIYKIALDTVTSIVKGIIWVFKKIGAFIKDVIEFIGFLFEWGDILDATDSVAAGFNAALDHGEELLNKKNIDAHQWLEDIRTTVLENLSNLQSNDYEGARAGDNTVPPLADVTKGDSEDETDQVKAGVTYNWSTYYFTYGGGPTNAVLHDDSLNATDSTEERVVKLWDDIQGEVETITKTVVKVAKDLVEFLNPSNYSVHELVNKIEGDLVNGTIDALEKLVDILFDALTVGISLVRDLANKVIDIPVITWLWKNVIAGGRPLTLLNFCSLLIAIPTTVLYKAKKKRAPPKLKDRLTKDTFSKYVDGQADTSLASDILGFSVAAESAVVLVGGEFETLSLLADGTFEGLGLETIPIGPIDGLMNVLDSASLTFDSIGGFATWPVVATKPSGVTTTDFNSKEFLKYTGWGLSGVSMVSSLVIKIVAKKKKVERPVVKRWKATTAAVMSVPKLCVSLAGDIIDAEEGTKQKVLIVDAFLETAATFGSTWGGSVAAWNNELENYLMYIGLAVKQACTLVKYELKLLDFSVEQLG
ncbi:hypothetical protein F4810DRAFT_586578 [Camillea tinctor]|nr:hypothetical protein F4810DRAFT_586578 [Camillea tinctor]